MCSWRSAPQFLTVPNLSQIAALASITAIAAIGQAIVVITRNIDLSVEATIGLVAYCVAITLEATSSTVRAPSCVGIAVGLGLGLVNGVLVAVFNVPSIVATLGTLSIFRGIDYLIAGSHQVALAGLPEGFTGRRDPIMGVPIFVVVVIVAVVVGTACSAGRASVGRSTPSAATRRRRRSSGSRPASSSSPRSPCAACSRASPV